MVGKLFVPLFVAGTVWRPGKRRSVVHGAAHCLGYPDACRVRVPATNGRSIASISQLLGWLQGRWLSDGMGCVCGRT